MSPVKYKINRKINLAVLKIMKTHTLRLKPQQDFLDSIEEYVKKNNIQAGVILSAVGSFTHVTIKFANQNFLTEYDGHFEIVSATGTVSIHGSHIHISISDGDGKTIGGHLVSGCKIYTTAEIVLAEFDDVIYKREMYENDSGYEELVVYKKA